MFLLCNANKQAFPGFVMQKPMRRHAIFYQEESLLFSAMFVSFPIFIEKFSDRKHKEFRNKHEEELRKLRNEEI